MGAYFFCNFAAEFPAYFRESLIKSASAEAERSWRRQKFGKWRNDKYYAVLNFRDESGKRVQKWVPLNLPVRGNKRKADLMLRQLVEQYQGVEAIEPINRLLGQHIAM